MKILLYNPPKCNGVNVIREDRCEIIERDYLLPPYSLLEVASLLKGHDVTLVDANAGDRLAEFCFDVVILRFTPDTIKSDFTVIGKINARYVVGICHALKKCPKTVLLKTRLDVFVTGDYEIVVPDLIGNMNKLENVGGIAYKKNGRIIVNEYITKNFDLVVPDYSFIHEFSRYYIKARHKPMSIIYSSKGCPFRCSFCNTHKKVRYKKLDDLIRELDVLKQRGVQLLSFFDETFTLNRKRALDICRILRNYSFEWYCNTRVDCLDENLIDAMYSTGCTGISLGIESGSTDVLKKANKIIDFRRAWQLIRYAQKLGIKISCAFILGLPGETIKTAVKTIKLARKLLPNTAQFNIALPYSGTGLELYAKKHKSLCSLSAEELGRLRRRAYISFYLNPKYIFANIIFLLKNPCDIMPLFKFMFRILKNIILYRQRGCH